MKLRIARDDFAQAVDWCAHALPHRSPVPALGGLLLTADSEAQRLTVAGFDYEVSARFEASAEVLSPGEVLVPGRLLADLARALPDHPVELGTDPGEAAVSGTAGDGDADTDVDMDVVCGPVQFSVPAIPREDYPRLPELPPLLGTVDGPAFAEAVAQVAVVAGRDEALPFLTGVRIELHGAVLRLVATDRYRLAVRELPWEPAADREASESPEAPEAVALVPAKSLYELARSLQKGERIALALTPEAASGAGAGAPGGAGQGLIGFRAGARQATTRLLAGEFITYQRIFPAAFAGEVVVGRQALLEAVKRISLVAERHQPVLLSLGPDRLTVQAGSGGEARGREELAAHYAGDPVVLAANAAYLTEGLTVLGTPFARLSFTTPTKPAVLTPCQSPEEAEDTGSPVASTAPYRYLFMPQRSAGRA